MILKQKGSLTIGTNNPFTTRMHQANRENAFNFISAVDSYYINRSLFNVRMAFWPNDNERRKTGKENF